MACKCRWELDATAFCDLRLHVVKSLELQWSVPVIEMGLWLVVLSYLGNAMWADVWNA